ncbi:cysteine--tRNA ligase [Maritimibacter sp. HL-12]|uniref:cysteine--tRNA ligase n=1 Tax=Maritimibacter sp. HL-12 TaxID=1162418 RepID=UPI000A0EF02E|nr:cysteine--tRNA ligase [Maritimibacter sp. HL-12]SMH57360.1 cysteinyl-tRNA synthetase [Maritimibacter sp. HL-12]
MVEIKLYNTATRSKQVFEPIDPDNVRMYVCGPTVYDRAHLGNARPVVVFDVLFRLLRHVYGPDHVTYVRNFTDVDDKIIARAKRDAKPIDEITAETTQWYLDDMKALGNLEPTQMPRATQHIGDMIAMIEDLIARGHAYEAEGHVLFAVDSYADYGKLSGRSVDDMIAGARVEVAPYKKNPMDFVLWKPAGADEPGWDSPWGRGRPGWHIECSAMSHEILGETFDIHGGGNDLQFPHHENEIAQSKCAHPGSDFARYWLHNEMLQVEGKKMSKSLGNFFTVRDLLEQGVPGEVIRFVFLGTHYRKPMDWTEKKRQEAEATLRKIARFLGRDPSQKPWVGRNTRPPEEFVQAVANDLNTPLALTLVSKYLKTEQESHLVASMRLLGFDDVRLVEKFQSFHLSAHDNEFVSSVGLRTFGEGVDYDGDALKAMANRLKELRRTAMETKDFSAVDALKTALTEAGVEVRMSKDGVELVPGAGFDPAKLEGL